MILMGLLSELLLKLIQTIYFNLNPSAADVAIRQKVFGLILLRTLSA